MGSRYGGLKQIEPVGPNNEIIMDYSVYDALKAGFDKVVFVIKKEIEHDFRERIGKKIEKIVNTAYVFQDINSLPQGFLPPEGRMKPWGTAHAILSCKAAVNAPFAVINADDFYGAASFELLANYLKEEKSGEALYNYCLVGFELKNTLSENGHVARGICTVNAGGFLTDIVERTHIERHGNEVRYTENGRDFYYIDKNSIVSMNTWGFTTSIFDELENRFPAFLKENEKNITTAEYFLPTVVDSLIKENKARVKALSSSQRWYGVTYKEDRETVKNAVLQMIKQSAYAEDLWSSYPQ